MTNAQKLAIKISEKDNRVSAIRARLNEIEGLETITDEVRAEQTTLVNEFSTVDGELVEMRTQHQAALIAEGEEESRARGEFGHTGDGESAEVRALLGRVSIADYLTPATAGQGIGGAAVELNEALEVPAVGPSGGVAIPWALLAGPPETRQGENGDPERRAFTDTGDYAGGVMQRPILQRLFGLDLMAALGVRIDTVPAGRTEWPLITGGVAPAQAVEGVAAAAAVEAAFSTETLKPKRLTGRYEYTHEMAAAVIDLEQALRRDLADAVRAKMSDLALNGDEETNPQEPDGFLNVTVKVPAPEDPAAVADYADYAGTPAQAVDGIHASMETEVGCVIGVASYRHAATVYQAGSGESGTEALKKRSMMCMASSFVPAPPAGGIQNGNIIHAAGPNGGGPNMRADSVAAVWPTLEVVRDIYTKASQGVVLTWITLWDLAAAFRNTAGAGPYKRVAYDTTA